MDEGSAEQWQRADEEVRKNLPSGVKFVRTLRGHKDAIGSVAWSPNGRMLASPSDDMTIRLWDSETGECLRTLEGHQNIVYSVAFDPAGSTLASGSADKMIKLWEPESGKLLCTLKGHDGAVNSVAFDPAGSTLASGSDDRTIKLWETATNKLLHTLKGHKGTVYSVAFDAGGRYLATGGFDASIKLWDLRNGDLMYTKESEIAVYSIVFDNAGHMACATAGSTIELREIPNGKLLRKLEGHTSLVTSVSYLSSGRLLASKCKDGTVRLWSGDTGACLGILDEPSEEGFVPGLAFHPILPLLAIVGSDPGTPTEEGNRVIHILELDLAVLLGQPATPSVTYTSAKIVMVGESGAGKTGLGWRLAHGEFKEHSSTHGMQFWLLRQLCKQRLDGAQCEAVLWDLAGQPDYRLTHALFLDDADLALVLFDLTRNDDPLSGVEFWLRQLKVEARPLSGTPTMLIAARSDRGMPRLTQEELQTFCQQRGIAAYLPTSAKSGQGIEELIRQMYAMIPWDAKPATVTTETFKRIKDFVLTLKEDNRRMEVILTPDGLRQRLEETDRTWKFSDDEMLTAVGHLATHGYVTRLKTSQGGPRILLAPELLNNLAASFVLEARRNQRGLGSLEEQRLVTQGYKFPELEKLIESEKDILLDSAIVLFLEHNVCFRETDPLNGHAYLVFPELINLKKPFITDDVPTEEAIYH